VAQRDFAEGELLFTEEPFANVLTIGTKSKCCDFCLRGLSLENIPKDECPSCSAALYCSPMCQARAWVQYHRVLCPRNIGLLDEIQEELEREESALKYFRDKRKKTEQKDDPHDDPAHHD